jgi:hypothetical protein
VNDLDPSVAAALDRYVAGLVRPEDWNDVLRRAGLGTPSPAAVRPRRRVVLAFAAAAALAAGVVGGALGQDLVRRTLDDLAAWVGSAAPGGHAPADEQQDFARANAQALAQFPPGTTVGLLTRASFGGASYDLLGFRDGGQLCLRLVRSGRTTELPATCAPQEQLVDLGRPAAVFDAEHPLPPEDPVATAVYGIAADDVTRVVVQTAITGSHVATLARNAFVYVGPPVEFRGLADRGDVALRAIVTEQDGTVTTVPISTFPQAAPPDAADMPGPVEADHQLHGQVAWLEREEPRGAPFDWPGDQPAVAFARLLRPDPRSSFRVGVGYAKAVDPENGDWLCLSWLWPLAERPLGYGCTRDAFSDVTLQSTWPSGGEQFPLYVGLAADGVARITLFFANGRSEDVPVTDNVFTATIPQSMATKLVAYDADGRVVGVHVLSG